MGPENRSGWLKETLGFGLIAALFFQLSFFIMIFVIPLAVLFRRRGFIPGIWGSLLAFSGIAGVKVFQLSRIPGGLSRPDLFGLDLVIPGVFLLGLLVMEMPRLRFLRTYQRLLAATAAAVLAGIPLIHFVAKSPEFDEILRLQITAMIKAITAADPLGSAGENAAIVEKVAGLSKRVFLDIYAAGYLFTLGFNWYVGTKIGLKSLGTDKLEGSLPSFRLFELPDSSVWWFLLSWAGVFAGFIVDLGFLGYVLWNSALTAAVFFGCQGAGIVSTWMERWTKAMRMSFVFMIVFMAFVPGINVLIAAGLPLLGVSELWIQYRSRERS